MKRALLTLSTLLVVSGFIFAQTPPTGQAASGDNFVFKYETGKTMAYTMKVSMGLDMEMAGEQEMKMKMVFEIRCNMKMTPTASPKKDVATLKLEATDIEGDWDIDNPGAHMVMKLRGKDLMLSSNDTVIIDTENGVGSDQADALLKELSPLSESGEMDVDTLGNVSDIRGSDAFVKFWKESMESQNGMFGIIFSGNPVPVNGKWQNKLGMSKMGEIQLEGEGLKIQVDFTRMADISKEGRKIKVFNVKAPFDCKNVVGRMGAGEQKTTVNIERFVREADGTILFDADRGMLVSNESKVTGNAKMNGSFGGQDVDMTLKMSASMSLKLATK